MRPLLIAIALAAALPLRAQCDRYPFFIQEIGTFGGTESSAVGLNGLGEVCGYARDAGGVYRAFSTDANLVLRRVDETIATASFGQAINDAGWVAGYANSTTGSYGFVRTGETTSFLLNNIGGKELYALSVNGNGVACGYQLDSQDSPRPWRTDVSMGVHALPMPPAATYAGAIAINLGRQCAGYGEMFIGDYLFERAIRWDANEQPTVLGTLGGYYSYAYAINNLGQVAGEAETSTLEYHVFRTVQGTNVMQDLGSLGGAETSANGINDTGDVCGATYVLQGGSYVPQRAFVYLDQGPIKDLMTLIDPSKGWVLKEALTINNRRQVVGWGLLNGVRRAFRLTPNGDPFPYGDANLDGAFDVLDITFAMRVAGGLEKPGDVLTIDVAPSGACNGRGFGDGKVTLADAARIARRIAGLEPSWP